MLFSQACEAKHFDSHEEGGLTLVAWAAILVQPLDVFLRAVLAHVFTTAHSLKCASTSSKHVSNDMGALRVAGQDQLGVRVVLAVP